MTRTEITDFIEKNASMGRKELLNQLFKKLIETNDVEKTAKIISDIKSYPAYSAITKE